jgi:tRNA (guanine37-N1)-methyltransferase
VHEVSIGDYVLGGGEVASMVMIEAITRLIPGVLGNPESLAEESHNSEGYLEYPNFTKPQEWRGISVPEILLSGNHAEIAKWRTQQAQKRAEDNF